MHHQKIQRALLAALALTSACATPGNPDPIRGFNEKMYRFNEGFDQKLFEPVAEGYDAVTGNFFQTMIGNFFENATVPRTFLNDVLQGKPLPALQDIGRFSVNVIAGLGGMFDMASEVGIPKNEEDFGQTFGRWGAGPGAYVVIPLAGPSSVRDLTATPLDIATNPITWLNVFGLSIVDVVNTRAQYLEELAQARRDAVDFYVFQRDAYLSRRERDVRDGAAPEAADDDLYDIDDLEDESTEGAATDEAQP